MALELMAKLPSRLNCGNRNGHDGHDGHDGHVWNDSHSDSILNTLTCFRTSGPDRSEQPNLSRCGVGLLAPD